jgi:hypothetical protein
MEARPTAMAAGLGMSEGRERCAMQALSGNARARAAGARRAAKHAETSFCIAIVSGVDGARFAAVAASERECLSQIASYVAEQARLQLWPPSAEARAQAVRGRRGGRHLRTLVRSYRKPAGPLFRSARARSSADQERCHAPLSLRAVCAKQPRVRCHVATSLDLSVRSKCSPRLRTCRVMEVK